jgi:hypothetical protein
LRKFFHENHLFFESFEIITKTNGYLFLIIFQKTSQPLLYFKIFKELELIFLKKFKKLHNTNSKIGPRVLPWYNLGFTQFLKHNHNKLTFAQTQCSQGYHKLVE